MKFLSTILALVAITMTLPAFAQNQEGSDEMTTETNVSSVPQIASSDFDLSFGFRLAFTELPENADQDTLVEPGLSFTVSGDSEWGEGAYSFFNLDIFSRRGKCQNEDCEDTTGSVSYGIGFKTLDGRMAIGGVLTASGTTLTEKEERQFVEIADELNWGGFVHFAFTEVYVLKYEVYPEVGDTGKHLISINHVFRRK